MEQTWFLIRWKELKVIFFSDISNAKSYYTQQTGEIYLSLLSLLYT